MARNVFSSFLLLFLLFVIVDGFGFSLKTNGMDVYAFPSRMPTEKEWQYLAEAYTNEVRLLSGYIRMENHDLIDDSLRMIIESKKYHIGLIGEIHKKYDAYFSTPSPDSFKKTTNSIQIKDACKAKVKEELVNKMFYEKSMYHSDNEDIKKVFGLIANNSEAAFKILQYYIPKIN